MRFLSALAVAAVLVSPGLAATAHGQTVGVGRGGGSGPGGAGMPTGPAILAPLPEGTGTITGVVLDAMTGQPIEGAIVAISVTGNAPVARVAREVTDDKGRFVFAKLPERADYLVTAGKTGYFDASYGQQESEVSSGSRIQLVAGQTFSTARITLKKMAAIGGIVTDENNEPVVGIYVRALAVSSIAGARQYAAGPIALTDDRGMYRIAGLPPGLYLVSVPTVGASIPAESDTIVATQFAPFATFDPDASARFVFGKYPIPPPARNGRAFAYPITFSPGATSPTAATPIAVGAGDERGDVNVHIQPQPSVRISGIVQGPAEAYAGLTLRLLTADLEDMGGGSETATALVGANGSFTFLNVPPGAYVLDASRRLSEYVVLGDTTVFQNRLPMPPGTSGYGSNSSSLASAPPNIGVVTVSSGSATDSFSARTVVNVGAADISGLVVSLQSNVTMSGRVIWEDGSPPPVFFASADPATGKLSLGRPTAIVDAARSQTPDEFTIEGLHPAAYFLRPRAENYVVKSIVLNGRDYANQPFDLADGRDISGVVVTFTKQGAKVQGVVRASDSTASPEATVLIFPADESEWTNFGLTPTKLKSARVSTAGAFALAGLPAGNYLIVAVPPAQGQSWLDGEFLKRAARSATPLTLTWGQNATVNLTVGRIR